MMKSYIVVIAVTISCLASITPYAQNKLKTDLQRNNLFGPVRIVKVEKAVRSTEAREVKEVIWIVSEVTVYNQAGNKIEEAMFNEAGVLTSKKVFSYNDSMRLNNIVEVNTDGIIIDKTVFAYDILKNGIVESHYNADGLFVYKRIRTLNEKGETTKVSQYDREGEFLHGMSISENAEGNRVETTLLSVNGVASNVVAIQKENQTEVTAFDSANTQTDKIITTSNSDKTQIKTTVYDANGNLTTSRTFTHKLDSHGNWVFENMFQEDPKSNIAKLVETTIRTITYY